MLSYEYEVEVEKEEESKTVVHDCNQNISTHACCI